MLTDTKLISLCLLYLNHIPKRHVQRDESSYQKTDIYSSNSNKHMDGVLELVCVAFFLLKVHMFKQETLWVCMGVWSMMLRKEQPQTSQQIVRKK